VATPPATELAAPSTQSGGSVLGEFGSALLGVFGGSA